MFTPELAFQSQQEQAAFQVKALQQLLPYLKEHAPFYKKHLSNYHHSINSLDDLQHFPTTTKEMMQQNNWDFLCVPRENIVEYTATSGTLGKPVTIALTEKDLQRLAYNEQQSFTTAGIKNSDVVQLLLTLDKQFMAGMAYYAGLRNIGAAIIRTGPGVPALQWEVAQRLQATTWVAVPSFINKLLSYAQANNIDYNACPVKKIICIGEPVRKVDGEWNVLGKSITDQWSVCLHGTYAATEMQSAFTECSAGKGGHLQPDLIVLEILDDEGHQLPAGTVGEVTITTLGIEGMPLFRYRTGDLAAYENEMCTCGRKSLRLGSIVGRKQQMIKLKGTTLYPPALFDVLNDMHEVEAYIAEVSKDEWGNDALKILVSTTLDHAVCEKIVLDKLQARLRVKPDIIFKTQAEIMQMQFPEANRKPIRWIDLR